MFSLHTSYVIKVYNLPREGNNDALTGFRLTNIGVSFAFLFCFGGVGERFGKGTIESFRECFLFQLFSSNTCLTPTPEKRLFILREELHIYALL